MNLAVTAYHNPTNCALNWDVLLSLRCRVRHPKAELGKASWATYLRYIYALPATTDIPLLGPWTAKSQTQKADSSRVKGEKVDTKKTPKNLGGGKATPEETLPSTKDSKSAAKKVKTSKAKPAPEATPGAHHFISGYSFLGAAPALPAHPHDSLTPRFPQADRAPVSGFGIFQWVDTFLASGLPIHPLKPSSFRIRIICRW